MTFSKYKQFDPDPGDVWSVSTYDVHGKEEPGTYVYYFVERLPPTEASARFASSFHTWKVRVLEAGQLAFHSHIIAGTVVESQFGGVSTGYGPLGCEHDEGWDSYDNCFTRLA